MHPNRRACIKHDEDPQVLKDAIGIELEAFKNYSRTGCLLECRAKHLIELCGCLPYYYPDLARVWTGGSSHCDVDGLRCLAERP